MNVNSIQGLGANSRVDSLGGNDAAFRSADFMAIMLSEITHQDPLDPADTNELVKGMQQLQELANTRFEKYRADVGWAQNLMGQTVVVGQSSMSEREYERLVERGLNPDRGFGTTEGTVSHFRTIDETVWVSIGEHDYPIDNVQTVTPPGLDDSRLSAMSDHLLGRNVGFLNDEGGIDRGAVERVSWDPDGNVYVQVNGLLVPFERIRSIGQA
ncbi:MAG: flagellar hook capping FlgD N-terminal domain-containing protein [Planctomycetota bacterium]